MEPIGEYYSKAKALEYLEAGYVVIIGGGTSNPYFSTDSASALRGIELEADACSRVRGVDGVYTADPEKRPCCGEVRRKSPSMKFYRRNLKVMDMTAFTLCREKRPPGHRLRHGHSGATWKRCSPERRSAHWSNSENLLYRYDRTKKPNNKRLILMIVLLAVVIALMWLLPDGSQPAAPATNAPKTEQTKNTNDAPDDIEATTLVKAGTQAPDSGWNVRRHDLTLGSLRGKVVLLNFWATWCGPCREELSRVQKDIIDRFKGNEDFVFLPVSRGETRETVAAFREKMGYTFPMGLDPEQKIYRLYASNYIPRNFLIGKDAKLFPRPSVTRPPNSTNLILLIERQLNSAN